MKFFNKKFIFPHPIVSMFVVILVMSILTYILPAGEYSRIRNESTGRMVVDPNSFQIVNRNPITPLAFFMSIPKGLSASNEIIFFIIIVSGAFQIINSTGAIETFISRIALKFRNKEKIMIPAMLLLFSIGGATFGLAEENIILIPMGIALARALGYDALTGMALVVLGAGCGFCSGIMNPFTVGVAQEIAELPLFSGIILRIIVWFVMIVFTAAYLIKYALKVKKNPNESFVKELEVEEASKNINLDDIKPITKSHKVIMLIMLTGFTLLIFGVFKFGWYIKELSALFLAMGIFCGIANLFTPNKIVREFLDGARAMSTGAVMVGVARGILVIMQDGLIIDTVIYGLSAFVQVLPKNISVLGIYAVQVVINFFVPSGTGQAAATMPIMIPLADVLNINRQVAVLAFQFGDGFTSYIIPTSGTLMALLSIAKIPYDRWLKFMSPLLLIWLSIGAIFIVIANMINYGPF